MSIRPVAGKLVQHFPGRYTGDGIFVIATVKLKTISFLCFNMHKDSEGFLSR